MAGHGGREVLWYILRGEPRDGDHQGHHLENLEPALAALNSLNLVKEFRQSHGTDGLHWMAEKASTGGSSGGAHLTEAAQGMAAVPTMQIQPGGLWAPSLRAALAGT